MNDHVEAAKERCYQEQVFFTGTSVAFSGFLGALQSGLSTFQTWTSIGLVALVAVFASSLISDRAVRYKILDLSIDPARGKEKQELEKWSTARKVWFVFREKSGARFCVVVVLASALGVAMLLYSKLHSANQALHATAAALGN